MDTGTEMETGDETDSLDRRLPENCAEYMLFVSSGSLEPVRKAAIQLCNQLTADYYIWQRDSFNLQARSDRGAQNPRLP